MDVADHWTEWGIESMPNLVVECEDEEDARAKQALYGGTLVAREWYTDGWAEDGATRG
jgi:hypothetical protein